MTSEIFGEIHVDFPSTADKADDDGKDQLMKELIADERGPVIILLGWTGSQHRHLQKYSAIYEKTCIRMRYIASMEDVFYGGRNLRQAAQKLINLIFDLHLESRPIFVHVFSNGGGRVYHYLSELIHNTPEFQCLRLRGIIFDSCPSQRRVGIAVRVYLMTAKQHAVLKYFFAAILLSFLLLAKFLSWVGHSVSVLKFLVTDNYFEFLRCDPSRCPQLYLYSAADEVIPSVDVEQQISFRRSLGVHVVAQCWDDSVHVAHMIKHRETYINTCLDFINNCLLG